MGKDKTKLEKPKEEKQIEKKAIDFNEENLLRVMKELGSKNITSTMIRDAFELDKEHGRGIARRMLGKLEKTGKIEIRLKQGQKRKQYLYDVVDNPGPIVYDPTKERELKRR